MLNGRPYIIDSDRIFINEDVIDFVRVDDLTNTQKSFYGIAVYKKDESSAYVAPVSNNDDVRIDTLSQIFIIPTSTVTEVITNVTTDVDYWIRLKKNYQVI